MKKLSYRGEFYIALTKPMQLVVAHGTAVLSTAVVAENYAH